jgi:protein-tyrosine phosphatase
VAKGMTAQNAIARVRRLRPGSIETDEQAEVLEEYAKYRARSHPGGEPGA